MVSLNESLLDSGRLGVVVLGPDRRIDGCLGTLVSSLAAGSLASEVLPFLAGLDDVLDEIASGQRSSFTLPRVALEQGSLAERILSFEIMPSETPDGLQILVRDESELAGLEQNVLQQRNELALANEALTEAKQRMELALREKSSFLANISHDLKTPLQVIMGNAEILRGDLPEEERQSFLQDVLDNSNFLLALITDLLDASALEVDQLELTEDVVDINALLERALSMMRQVPDGKDRHFTLDIDGESHAVLADPMRLRRLLLNVLGNAVKFTDDGGQITVRASTTSMGDLLIEIEDDGCGIDPLMMKRVFEPFTRGGKAEGSGLGLHIAKKLADLHEAELTLSSERDAGTVVRLRLPKFRVVNAPS